MIGSTRTPAEVREEIALVKARIVRKRFWGQSGIAFEEVRLRLLTRELLGVEARERRAMEQSAA